MKSSFVLGVLIMAALAAPAAARPNPQPKPSGIVVHLFGPNSISSNILPRFAVSPHPAPNAAAPGLGALPGGVAQGGAAQPANDAGPTVGNVLHQMFVTGDPDRPPGAGIAPGRAAQYPRAASP